MGFIIFILFIGVIFLFFSYSNTGKEQVRTNLSGSNRMKYPMYARYLENFVINGIRKNTFKLIFDKNDRLIYEMDFYGIDNIYNGKLELVLVDEEKLCLRGTYRHFYGLKFIDSEIEIIYIQKEEINNQDDIALLILKVMDNVDLIRIRHVMMGYV